MLWNRRAALGGIVGGLAASSLQAQSEDAILIGQFAAFSGPAAALGTRLKVGIDACFKAVNAQGLLGGRVLKLITEDDAYDPERAKVAVRKLIEENKVFALIGAVGTPTGLAAVPILTEAKVPLVGMFTGAEALRTPFNRYVFHVRASYFDETERIVQHLTTIGISKIAVFYQNDAYGKAGLEGVERALTKRQLKAVATGTVERNSVDVGKALDAILSAQPEAIVQISAYKSCAAFIKQARAKAYAGQFFNVSFVGSKALSEELGPAGLGVVISQVVPYPFLPNTPIVREYQQRMRESGQTEYDFSSMEGYLMAKVLVEGLRRAGRNATREGLINALEELRDFNLGGFGIRYSPQNHLGSSYTNLTLIGQNGKFMQ